MIKLPMLEKTAKIVLKSAVDQFKMKTRLRQVLEVADFDLLKDCEIRFGYVYGMNYASTITIYPKTHAALEYIIYYLQEKFHRVPQLPYDGDPHNLYTDPIFLGGMEIVFAVNIQTPVLEEAIGDTCILVEHEKASVYRTTTVICRNGES